LSPFSLKSAFAGGFPPSLGLAFDVSAKAGTGNPPAIVQTIMAVFRSAVRLSDTRVLCCNTSMTEGVRRGQVCGPSRPVQLQKYSRYCRKCN